jgi:hypothetical protein
VTNSQLALVDRARRSLDVQAISRYVTVLEGEATFVNATAGRKTESTKFREETTKPDVADPKKPETQGGPVDKC